MSMPAKDTPVRSCALGGQSCRSQSYWSLLDFVRFNGWHPRKCLTDTSTCRAIGSPHVETWPPCFYIEACFDIREALGWTQRDEAELAAASLLARTIIDTIIRSET